VNTRVIAQCARESRPDERAGLVAFELHIEAIDARTLAIETHIIRVGSVSREGGCLGLNALFVALE